MVHPVVRYPGCVINVRAACSHTTSAARRVAIVFLGSSIVVYWLIDIIVVYRLIDNIV